MPSYSPVFSEQFIVRKAEDPIPSFIVPTGYTAVVRDFSAYDEAGAAIVLMTIQDDVDAPTVVAAMVSAVGVPSYGQWQGRVVVPEAGIIGITEFSVVTSADIYVGGYLLRNTLS